MLLQPTDSNPGHQEYLRTLLPRENGAAPTGSKYQGNIQGNGLLMPSDMYTKTMLGSPDRLCHALNKPAINYSSPATTHYSATQGNLYL